MNRKQVYIEAFEKATMERKIKSVKALEAVSILYTASGNAYTHK
jgi:hypothetical protein